MRRLIWVMVAVAVVAGVVTVLLHQDDYELHVVMPTASGTFVGARTTIEGQQVGQVTAIAVRGDKAEITVTVDSDHAPMHAGTSARIDWNSVLGVRTVELLPGPSNNPELPSGRTVFSDTQRVELDDVLAALDAPTRQHVQSLVGQLQQTLQGRENDLNGTLRTAGPMVAALADVLRGVGQDGPAIRGLITQLDQLVGTLDNRHNELSGTVTDLHQLVSQLASRAGQLQAALGELPSTLRAGTDAFQRVPSAVDATVPLLRDLRPTADQLPALAQNLSPVLTRLGPTVAALRPTLTAAQSLLDTTPGLLDSADATVPGVTQAVQSLSPAVSFLRPYTPEVVGFVTNWTSLFSNMNASGHLGRALVTESASSVNNNPGLVPPGMQQDPRPAPGSLAGQPWTDANGDGIR
ncbi:MCE family protein [Amycolatopsis sp. K13G38]|uniref:MCE family protein n=1 Tax=Amycolatopsis acididurans TaxID=2724524 RepID=A0ABX1J368_9PSEU|nr:MlaD family protein [Amycolatopsis acididurans]NKQ54228.1 MCE family protein [Amycolatopsis acididurans]